MNDTKNIKAKEKTLLTYLVREPKIKTGKPPLLILMHGVGSNERDLFSLAEHLPENFLIISARGPFTVGSDRYAWYQVDFSTGKPMINPGQEEKSRNTLVNFLDQLKEHYLFNEDHVYLGGFSQGAIMSYSVGLTHPEKVKGIVVLSGRLLEEVKPQAASPERLQHLKIFISHGRNDNVLNIQYARESLVFLKEAGLSPEYHEYNAGHGVSHEMLADLHAWLKSEESQAA